MAEPPHDLARRLADRAEAVCRHYLSNGRRQGNYWTVGDVRNTPGRSMFVRLRDTAKGSAGRWTDAATGEHGDLLDVVREALGLIAFGDVAKEARSFLGVTHVESSKRSSSPWNASYSSSDIDWCLPDSTFAASKMLGSICARLPRSLNCIQQETNATRAVAQCSFLASCSMVGM